MTLQLQPLLQPASSAAVATAKGAVTSFGQQTALLHTTHPEQLEHVALSFLNAVLCMVLQFNGRLLALCHHSEQLLA